MSSTVQHPPVAPIFHAPNWRDHRRLTSRQLPYSVARWLLDRGSLTERLIRHSQGQFRVEVIHQGWQHPQPHEARLLRLRCRKQVMIRETLLLCNDVPHVFARSAIPVRTLSGPRRRLRKLSNQSLGALLFKDPTLRRSPFQVALASPHQFGVPADLAATLPQAEPLWGRRSLFHLNGHPLLVAEIFLPNFQP